MSSYSNTRSDTTNTTTAPTALQQIEELVEWFENHANLQALYYQYRVMLNYYSFTFGMTPWAWFEAINISGAIGLLNWQAEAKWQRINHLMEQVRASTSSAGNSRGSDPGTNTDSN